MDSPETHASLGMRHRTKRNKTKNTTQRANMSNLQKTGEPRCSWRV